MCKTLSDLGAMTVMVEAHWRRIPVSHTCFTYRNQSHTDTPVCDVCDSGMPVYLPIKLSQRLLLIVVELQASSPACTELEIVMMDWLAKLIKLPEAFMSSGLGGGVIQVNVTP